ncbi:MAG: hypothetical protein U0804_00340 [Gemmataceae bacterium]
MVAFDSLLGQLVAVLFAWALLWLAALTAAMVRPPGDWGRAFLVMSGLWAVIDGGIAWYALVAPPPADLATLLKVNAGLDVLYVLTGVALLTRRPARLKGFGAAVVVQGAFLLVVDVTFWLRAG